ncbi:hypothetical protein N8301_04415 [Cyclobacteriaceae bacterium]|nr:hypothetical protein [Cyclobacteriaceae bacterium]
MLGKIYSKLIVRYGDKRAPLAGPLAEKGYLIISDYFNEEDQKQFGEISNVLESGEESVDILNRFPFLSKPVKDERIVSIIRKYLGDHAVLDFASAKRFWTTGPKSDNWHHDSVGHRIKIFVCLTDQDDTTHTQIIPNSNLIRYNDYQNTRLDSEKISKNHDIIKLIGKKNDLIIFDTNGMHTGVYSEKPRDLVQYEFSDIRKSMLRGHVGPRRSSFDNSITQSPLIAKHKLRSKGETFFYE